MAIEKLPQVRIGSSDLLFGGYIYNLSFSVAGGEEGQNKTTATVNVASEDHNYTISEDDLSTVQSYNVQIGNFSLPMYLETYEITKSAAGSLLKITFIDGSFILDKFWVGLNKSVWDNDVPDNNVGDKPNYIIALGREFHDCDINNDGKVDFKDLIDPCDPCITESQKAAYFSGQLTDPSLQAKLIDCDEMSRTKIFEVKYNFDDLIQNVSAATGISFETVDGGSPANPNPKYFQKYSGTLREVINRWCADFGWCFFFTDNKVVFLDVSHVIQVAKTTQDFCPNLAEYTEEHSLRGTVMGTTIALFQRAGEYRNNTCENSIYLALSPYMPGQAYVVPSLEIDGDIDPIAAGISYYSPYLRDLYWWFVKYKLNDPSRLKVNTKIKELGLTILYEPISIFVDGLESTNPLDQSLVDPAILLQFPPGYPTDSTQLDKSFLDAGNLSSKLQLVQQAILGADDVFLRCFKLLPPKEQWAYAQDPNNYYFFIASYDPEEEAMHYNEEKEFASDFLGKYYVFVPDPNDPMQSSFFEDDRIINDITQCNGGELIDDGKLSFKSLNGNSSNHNDDSVTYYNDPAVEPYTDVTTLAKLPFHSFLKIFRNYQEDGSQYSFGQRKQNFKLLQVSVGGERFYPSNAKIDSTDDDESNQQVSNKHTIQDQSLIKSAHSYYIKNIGSRLDENGEEVAAALINANKTVSDDIEQQDKDSSKISLFWGRRAQDESFKVTIPTLHYHETQLPGFKFDGVPLNKRAAAGLLDETETPSDIVYKYPSLRCKDIGRWNNLCRHIVFSTPTSTFEYSEPSNSTYGIVMEKTKNTIVRVEKKQRIYHDGQEPNDKVLAVQVNQMDISDNDIKKRVFVEGTCLYSNAVIDAYADELRTGLTFSQTTPTVRKSFTIAGTIDNIPKIEDGLMSIEMSLDREGGLRTTFNLGTLLMHTINQDIYNGLAFNTPNTSYFAPPTSNPPYKQS